MKKFVILLTLIGCSSAFAYITGKTPIETKAIYCPAEINCTSNSLDSCKFDSADAQYFSRPEVGGARIIGQHVFSYVNGEARGGGCIYDRGNGFILPFKPEANLVPFDRRQPPSSWSNGLCGGKEGKVELCPVKENLGFVIRNANVPEIIWGSINDKVIPSARIELKSYARIGWKDALAECGSEKVCTIDLLSKSHKYGAVKFDTDSMKIIQVSPFEPKKFQIHKVDFFNTIEIIKMDEERDAIYCPSEIKCTGRPTSSCSFSSSNAKYFGEIIGSPEAGTWGFNWASSHDNKYACNYSNSVSLSIKPTMALEAYYNKPDSAWGRDPREKDRCKDSATLCPFKHLEGVAIYNYNVGGGVKAAIADKIIPGILIPPSKSLGISHDEALPGCSGKKECIINLLSGQNVKYGSVKIDTDTMKVLETNSLYPSKIEINMISDSFNTVEVRYAN
ncbi:MAG: hypothetical protein ACYC0J_04715 [Gammaproteobacteria bacterium]